MIGAPGCGKSTVGTALAIKLGTQFIDMDCYIENKAGCSIVEMFTSGRESVFRGHETDALRTLMALTDGSVIATGGGIVLSRDNRELLAGAKIIFLDADEDVVWKRVEKDLAMRPLLSGQDPHGTLTGMMRQRRPLYRQLATHTLTVDSTTTVATLVQKIRQQLFANA
ncbi:MAG: shikimate kinase [Candidatus Porifericomitaceae bacterium WSBS_2022_MAG_OTU9]